MVRCGQERVQLLTSVGQITAGSLLLSLTSQYFIPALWFTPFVGHHCSNRHKILNSETILYVLKFAVTLL